MKVEHYLSLGISRTGASELSTSVVRAFIARLKSKWSRSNSERLKLSVVYRIVNVEME